MFFNIALAICVFQVKCIHSYILHLNINELEDNAAKTQNTNNNKQLDAIINAAETQRDGLTSVAVFKCLRDMKSTSTRLRCIRDLAERRDREPVDLTRSGEDRLSERSDFADDYIDFFSLRSGRELNEKERNGRRSDFLLKKILRTNSYSDSEDDIKRLPKYSSNRYKPKVRKDRYSYMQAPSRVYEMNLDRRRRLPHFLPKRQHWDEDDFKSLRNYWIHGSQGKYPGSYRIPF